MRFIRRGCADGADISRLTGQGITPVLAELLAMRGITGPDEAARFLRPDASQLYDPYLIPGMDKAAARINQAIEGGLRITVYGDYDVDGVTATAIMMGYLNGRGAKALYYIPSRHEEGYGLNAAAIRQIAGGCDLLITVDCGITARDETALAQSLGMDVIITDHHHLIGEAPSAHAVVDPLIGEYPCPHLCGAGVALKLVQALGGLEAALSFIDLAALGTVADIVPLTGENRAIAALGLAKMNADMRIGIKALCDVCGISGKPLSAGHLGYALGPRINAGGRIDKSSKSVDMLLTDDYPFALGVAEQLNLHNKERQRQEAVITAECERMIEDEIDLVACRAIVICGQGWNHGVVGIVASRLAERYCMPCILLAEHGDGLVTGSGRSIKGVHLLNALMPCANLFSRFGGHEMAAGITMPSANLAVFRRRINEFLAGNVPDSVFEPSARYDLDMDPGSVTLALCREITQLEPCGMGNPSPVFLFKNARCADTRQVGAQKQHIKTTLTADTRLDAVGFHMAARQEVFSGRIDALAELSVNEWNGQKRPQAMLRAAEPSAGGVYAALDSEYDEIARDFLRELIYNGGEGFGPCDMPEKPPDTERGSIWLYTGDARSARAMGDIPLWLGAPPADKRAFPCAVALPVINGQSAAAYAPYRRFFLLNGQDPALCARIKAVAPDAEIFVARHGRPSVYALAHLGVDALRECYGYARKRACQLNILPDAAHAARKAAGELNATRLQFYFAVMVFDELGLLRADFGSWGIRAAQTPQKTDLGASRMYAYVAARAAHG